LHPKFSRAITKIAMLPLALLFVFLFSVHSALIPGVHTPLSIHPTVDIPDSQWLLDVYKTVFARNADAGGYRTNFQDLQNGSLNRGSLFTNFVNSPEFRGNPQLSKRTGFIIRVYQAILGRTPSQPEIDHYLAVLHGPHGEGPGSVTWPELLDVFYGSPEFKFICPTQYYTLGSRVNPSALLMQNLFNKTARLQVASEAQLLGLNIPTAQRLWDQKIPVIHNPFNQTDGFHYVGFTRAFMGGNTFTIVALSSQDAVNFVEIGPLFEPQGGQTFYDGHVSLDYTFCPPRWVMAMECVGHGGAASLCTSFSTYPSKPETWTNPFILVDGCVNNNPPACGTRAAESASTGVLLVDGHNKYAAWTQVYDGVQQNDPLAHTYSQSTGPLPSFFSYFGTVMGGKPSAVTTMMSAEAHPWCTDAWDCNNRDKQDWKREGNFYYALYNGANYYRCNGAWGISISRSSSPVGPEYVDRLPLSQGIPAALDNTCGISYPMLNVIEGELYVYYAFRTAAGAAVQLRSKLIPL
jgi:hypothetical protein